MMSVRDAWTSPSKQVEISESLGCISANMICPYPPGIPLVVPGEIFDSRRVEWLLEQNYLWPEWIPSKVSVVC